MTGGNDELTSSKKEESYAYFVTKFAQHFPSFDARACETQLRRWEEYWDSVTGFQRITNCSDLILAYLIKDSAVQGSELDICLKDITHTGEDGYTDINTIGLKVIKARMLAPPEKVTQVVLQKLAAMAVLVN